MFAAVRLKLEYPFKRWIAYWFGVPPEPARQFQFYRCEGCYGLVSWNKIKDGGCDCGMSSRVRGAKLGFFEKARLMLLPWTV